MSQHLEEIRLRVSIEDLVGGYVQLKKAGRNLKGLCPFHGEKTPSFMVSPEKGIAYCFGCHQGGDIFKFIQIVENVDFQEAVRLLAERAGVRLPKQSSGEFNKRHRVIEINQAANQFYQSELLSYSDGLNYFTDRGLTKEAIQYFQLGYAPDSFNQLKDFLIGKGFESRDLLDAAVVNQRSLSDQKTYDRFRGRLIFPIFDHQGNIVGFSGRIIGDGEPKYLNSPDTPAYNKSLTLYGLNFAKDSIKQNDLAIFVEGYMDVISTHQAGTKNTIATCGTAVTPQQLKLIKRYTKNVAFAFDQDSAGMEATFRAIELAQMANLNIKIISIADGKDPDECVQSNPDLWHQAVKKPFEVIDFYLSYIQSKFDISSPAGIRESLQFILPIIKTYKSDVERGIYLNRLAVLLKTDVKLLWSDLKKVKSNALPQQNDASRPVNATKKRPLATNREERLLCLIFAHPELYSLIDANLVENLAFSSDVERFYNALKKVYTLGSSFSLDQVKSELADEKDQNVVDIYALFAEEEYGEFSGAKLQEEVEKLIQSINRDYLEKVNRNIKFQLQSTKDKEQIQQLMRRSIEVNQLINSYK